MEQKPTQHADKAKHSIQQGEPACASRWRGASKCRGRALGNGPLLDGWSWSRAPNGRVGGAPLDGHSGVRVGVHQQVKRARVVQQRQECYAGGYLQAVCRQGRLKVIGQGRLATHQAQRRRAEQSTECWLIKQAEMPPGLPCSGLYLRLRLAKQAGRHDARLPDDGLYLRRDFAVRLLGRRPAPSASGVTSRHRPFQAQASP